MREEERRLHQQIQALKDRDGLLKADIEALGLRLDFIRAITRDAPQTIREDLKRGQVDPTRWAEAWRTVEAGAGEALQAIAAKKVEAREVAAKIAKLEKELAQVRTGRRESIELRIPLQAAEAGDISLELQYQVQGASWSPAYEARLDTEAGKLALTQFGQVRQRTGEGWENVELTLSTARPGVGAQMPELRPWWLDFPRPIPLAGQAVREGGEDAARAERRTKALIAPAEPVEMREAEAHLSEFSARYRIPGRVTVPADNALHRYAVATHRLDAALSAKATPKLSPWAYLHANATFGGEAALPPGPLSLFRDGAFIGTAHMPLLRPGEARDQSFGLDDKIELKRTLLADKRSEKGLLDKEQRVERKFRMEVVNGHARAIPVTLLDQLPVSKDEEIKVEPLRDFTTPPTGRNLDERPGVLAWTFEAAPGEKRVIDFGYAVTYPRGREPFPF